MSPPHINRSVMFSFVEQLNTTEFRSRFGSLELPVKDFLEWIASDNVPAAMDIMSEMEEKASRRKSVLKESQFLSSDNLAPRELGTEQFCQVPRTSLAVQTYGLKNSLNFDHFFIVSRSWLSRLYTEWSTVPTAIFWQ